jgi:hypothetical protein
MTELGESGGIRLPLLGLQSPSSQELLPSLEAGREMLRFEIEIQRIPAPGGGAGGRFRFTPVTPPGAGWVTIASEEWTLTLPTDDCQVQPQPFASDELNDAIVNRTRFELRPHTLELNQGAGYEGFDDIAAPVKIDLLRDGTVVATWFDWWDFNSLTTAGRVRSLPLPSELDDGDMSTAIAWQVRVTSAHQLRLWMECLPYYWDGSIAFTVQLVESDGKAQTRR